MDDQKRTRVLAAILAAAVVLYLGRSGLNQLVLAPIQQAETRLAATAAEVEKLEFKEIALGVARKNLDDWRSISLPENSLNAQRLYREWVESLALQCGFGNLQVEPGRRPDRAGRYLSVTVDVHAETDLNGLSRFLFLFDQTNLLHRVADLNVKSTAAQGNPRLEVALTAEGISVVNSGERPELFTRTQLSADMDSRTAELNVKPTDAFPVTEPFQIRVDRELLRVLSVDGLKWNVQRGLLGTSAEKHATDAIVELLPVLWDRRDLQHEQYASFLAASPFAVPAPPKVWNPKIAGLSNQTIAPGQSLALTARGDDLNPDHGEPTFSLVEAVPGITLDSKTGQLTWPTEATQTVGTFPVRVAMSQTAIPETKIEAAFTVTVRIPNSAPLLQAPEVASVVLGQKFQLQLAATDDGPQESLTWSLGPDAPDGLSLDQKSGLLTWSPPNTFKPGEYAVDVTVADRGDEVLSTTKTLTLNVQDDSAILTLLTGAVSKDDVWYAWFRNKGNGEKQQLKIGEHLKVADIDAVLTSIETRSITLTDDLGVWTLMLGDTLRNRKLTTPATTSVPTAPAAEPAETPADPATPPGGVQPDATSPPE